MRKIVLVAVVVLGFSVGLRHAGAEETEPITTTIVYDNYPCAEGLKTDWGFSCFVQGMDETTLFDTGRQGDIFMANMESLKLDPCSVDIVVISHFHGDHTGGLDAFLERNSQVTVYVPAPKRDEFARRLEAKGVEVVWVDEELHERGLDLLEKSSDRTLSLVDTVSFQTIRDLKIADVFAFDRARGVRTNSSHPAEGCWLGRVRISTLSPLLSL